MERTQRRWSRRIYIRPAVATRPIPNSRPLPWSSASPRSCHRRWNHRRNEPSVITMGSERRSPDAASFFNFSLSLPLLFLSLPLTLLLYLLIFANHVYRTHSHGYHSTFTASTETTFRSEIPKWKTDTSINSRRPDSFKNLYRFQFFSHLQSYII